MKEQVEADAQQAVMNLVSLANAIEVRMQFHDAQHGSGNCCYQCFVSLSSAESSLTQPPSKLRAKVQYACPEPAHAEHV